MYRAALTYKPWITQNHEFPLFPWGYVGIKGLQQRHNVNWDAFPIPGSVASPLSIQVGFNITVVSSELKKTGHWATCFGSIVFAGFLVQTHWVWEVD